MAQALKRIEIMKHGDRWAGERKGRSRVYAEGTTKAKRDPRGRDGRIQEERTYPRADDPHASMG
jgi:hypothetical protein